MKCTFCNHPTGFLKSYHQECYEQTKKTVDIIERILNEYAHDGMDSSLAKMAIIETAKRDELFQNYLKQSTKFSGMNSIETVIWKEDAITIWEYKKWKQMIRTGSSYERHPVWKNEQVLLGKMERVIFTDKSVCLEIKTKPIIYSYKEITRVGFDKIFNQVFFDVKTSSDTPHRFLIRAYDRKQAEKMNNICLLLAVMSGQKNEVIIESKEIHSKG